MSETAELDKLKRAWRESEGEAADAERLAQQASDRSKDAAHAYADALMLAEYGIRRGEVIELKEKVGYGRMQRTVTIRFRILRFQMAWNDKPAETWIIGRRLLKDGKDGVQKKTVYGLGNRQWKKAEIT